MAHHQDDRTWGMHVNSYLHAQSGGLRCPSWANPAQRRQWKERGVIVWDQPSQTVTHLWANQALSLLASLQEDQAWETHGITFGEPVTRLYIGEPKRPPQPGLIHEITLDAAQTRELLSQLHQYESILRQMAEADEQERRRRLAAAYAILLDIYEEKEGGKE